MCHEQLMPYFNKQLNERSRKKKHCFCSYLNASIAKKTQYAGFDTVSNPHWKLMIA
jgi:hypothetical protein